VWDRAVGQHGVGMIGQHAMKAGGARGRGVGGTHGLWHARLVGPISWLASLGDGLIGMLTDRGRCASPSPPPWEFFFEKRKSDQIQI
jgi:hypothetical protein